MRGDIPTLILFDFVSTLRAHGSVSSVGEVKDDLFIRTDIYNKHTPTRSEEEL